MAVKIFLIVACFAMISQASGTTNAEICSKLRAAKKHCYDTSVELAFEQRLRVQGNVATQYLRSPADTLKITCTREEGLNLDGFPELDLSGVDELEVTCNFGDQGVLTKLRKLFNLTKLRRLKFDSAVQYKTSTKTNELSPELFQNFTDIEILEIKTGKDTQFNENVFTPLQKKLKSMTFHVFNLTELPRNIFNLTRLSSLSIVNYGNLRPEKLEAAKTLNFTLEHCMNLEFFHLSGFMLPLNINKLVNDDSFEEVEIVDNKNISLTHETFKHSKQIVTLKLSNNSLKHIPKYTFRTQEDLERLDLSFNQLEELHEDMFESNHYLEEVNLANNLLKYVSRKIFRNIEQLTALILSNNLLSSFNFENHLGPHTHLRSLDLQQNNISTLSGNFALTNLSSLDLSENAITRIFVEQFFNKTKSNLTINLFGNDLESIDFRNLDDMHQLEDTSNLYIHTGKEIRCNCHTISLFNFLTRALLLDELVYAKINIRSNIRCRNGYGGPWMVTDIGSLNILKCPLDFAHHLFCPDSCLCERLSHDGILKISCSNIDKVPRLPPYKSLNDIKLDKVELDVSKNAIVRLPSMKEDANYKDVVTIRAAHNSIYLLTIDNIPDNLVHLDLKFNRLKYVASDVLVKFLQLDFLQISRNPWNCSRSTELVKFVKDNRNIVKDFTIVQCSDEKYFLEVAVDSSNSGFILMAFVMFLVVSLIATLVVVVHIKRNSIAEWIFQYDSIHLIEQVKDKFKVFDATIVVAGYDKVLGKYIRTKLMDRPSQFKIELVVKDWPAESETPGEVLKTLKKSARTIIILSEYFTESDWKRWNYSNIGNRVIFVVKSRTTINNIDISNKFFINFHDPWFWDKCKHLMTHCSEMAMDEHLSDVEMQPLTTIATI